MIAAEPAAPRVELERRVAPDDPKVLVDFLQRHTGLSKQQLKDAAIKGAVESPGTKSLITASFVMDWLTMTELPPPPVPGAGGM